MGTLCEDSGIERGAKQLRTFLQLHCRYYQTLDAERTHAVQQALYIALVPFMNAVYVIMVICSSAEEPRGCSCSLLT